MAREAMAVGESLKALVMRPRAVERTYSEVPLGASTNTVKEGVLQVAPTKKEG